MTMRFSTCRLARCCFGTRFDPNSQWLYGLVAGCLLAIAPVVGAADTLLFDNLRAFGVRLDVGDPSLSTTNAGGRIIDGPKDIAVADLDGDNRPDIAVANKDGSVTVYFGEAGGEFGTRTHLHTEGGELRGIACADLTGDGRRDIAVGGPYDGIVYLFINGGNRTFNLSNIPAWRGARDLAAGDFDGDGLSDLAVAGTTNGVAHYRSLGGGTFELKTNIVTIGTADDDDFPQPAYYLRTFRPPGSTKDELAAARAQRQRLYVLATDADGRLAIQGTLTNIGVNALDVGPLLRPASNPQPDVVVAHNDRGTLEIHSSISTLARFSQLTNQVITVPGGPRNVRIADLDGDGWNDLIVVQQTFNKVLTFRNLNGVFVPTAEAAVGASPREMDMGDFNGDGHPDAAVLNRYSSDVSILITYPGHVGFGVPDSTYPVDGEVSGLEVRDFNNDEQDDVIQLHRASGELSVRLAGTNGVLGEPRFYQTGLRPIGRVVADLNGDGNSDLVTADMTPYITVRLGSGNGEFGLPKNYALPDPIPTWGMSPGMPLPSAQSAQLFSVEAADFDGDGKLDIAVGFWDCRLGFYRGDGTGAFTFTQAHVLFAEPRAMTAGDYDQDGDLDLVCASLYSRMAVIDNHGDLLDTTNMVKTIVETGIHNTSAIKAYDANGDPDPDLLIVGSEGAVLFFGEPGLAFSEADQSVSPPGLAASSIATADFDGDGDVDLASACPELACVTISLRNEEGQYVPFLTADVPTARFIAAGDVDGDGLADLIGTGETLWVALSSRLSMIGPPRLLPGARSVAARPVINELLAANASRPLDFDGGRNSDWVEIFNGASSPVSFGGWSALLIRSDDSGATVTNRYNFPNDVLPAGGHRVLVFSDRVRSQFHTGFNLPASGGTLCLFNPQGQEVDRVEYPPQQDDISYSRFRDGMPSFVACSFPTPGLANVDGGPVGPTLEFEGANLSNLQPDQPIRIFARSTDDVAVMGVTVLWQRIDIPNGRTNRLVLGDDGMSGDGGMLDGLFSGLLPPMPDGAEIQFYLEAMDISEVLTTSPGNPAFAPRGQPVTLHSLAVGVPRPPLEISEVVADNRNGLRDEGNGTPAWIEIRNCSTAPVSLAGVSIGQSFFGNGDRMFFTNVTLSPGQHHVIYADNNADQGPLHAPFEVNDEGDTVVLTGIAPNGARMLIDSVSFGEQASDVAWARLGCGGPWRESTPTPFGGNIASDWAAVTDANTITFGYPTLPGFTYTVEYTDSLAPVLWRPQPAVSGTGVEQTIVQPLTSRRFFRVRRQ